MHQATWHQFHPAALFTDRATGSTADQSLYIQFETRFDERKIAGT
jgi:hypothetical protein